MTSALDQSIVELLHASRDDWDTLLLPVSDRVFGFHTQQAIKKLVKALIGANNQAYPFIHDLERLVDQATLLGDRVPLGLIGLKNLTEYAGVWRYQEPLPLSAGDRSDMIASVAIVREYVMSRLPLLRPSFDWSTAN